MTISYSDNIFKLLAHWRGSVWKAVWKELLVWLVVYYCIKLVLELGLSQPQQHVAAGVIRLFNTYTEYVPLQFLLGFYVGQIFNRWWNQVRRVPYPEEIMAWVCAMLPENDRESKLKRHTIARYLLLTEVLALRELSPRVRKRFPTTESLLKAGLVTKEDLELYDSCPCRHTRWQLPLQWAINGILVPITQRDKDPITIGTMGSTINNIIAFREHLHKLFLYDWVSIPLAYTQTVSVVVYGYFALCCIGHQSMETEKNLHVPVLTLFQLVFYLGWLKVAQDLMRPFGTDDDDMELNYILDRNAQVAFTLAGYANEYTPVLNEKSPKLVRSDPSPNGPIFTIPYSRFSIRTTRDHPPPSPGVVFVKQQEHLEMVYADQAGRVINQEQGHQSINDGQKRAMKKGIRKLNRSTSERIFF